MLTAPKLERLNAEAAARAKRERRRANELKTRTIQRMQLQMTAPMDIGMEQNDMSLRGQDDIFDLEETARGLDKKGGLSALGDEDDANSSADEASGDDDDDEVLDSEEERERKVNGLEAELDGLYDAYQERMRERDAKYKVKEARKNSKDREEWAGIRKDDSEDEDSDNSEGGYDVMEKAKERNDEDSDSDSDSEDDSDIVAPPSTKRPRVDDLGDSSKQRKKARTAVATIPSSKSSGPLSRNAEVWFSQGLFKGTGLSDVEDDEDEDEMDVDSEVDLGEGPSSSVVSLLRSRTSHAILSTL